ncbi:MAG: homoserine/homoserine lactone efflux protein [Gammaproteobacteria bacterium]|nr:homoserine/homoserine lactone efflux protein [Gammaproteobacteria bacterium]
MTFELWLTFFIASLLISISPGPGAINTLSSGLRYGVRNSLPAILGLQLGYGAQIVVAGIGLGALLAASTTAFNVVKWFGIGYLVWLGYKKWTQPPLSAEGITPPWESGRARFWQAAFVNLTNPKATVFLLALFPQFLNTQADQGVQITVMGATLILVDIGVMLGYAALASQMSRWMRNERHQVIQNRVFGSLFVGAAALLAGFRNQ